VEKCYLGIGVVFQVPDQAGAEFADIGLDLAAVVPEGVQLGDDDLVAVSLAIAVAPGDQRPRHDDDQDSDGADYLGQGSQFIHLLIGSLMETGRHYGLGTWTRSGQDG